LLELEAEDIFMKPTLLIADGDTELCALNQRLLTKHGYQVETAADGLDCLAKLRRATPAAVVLDLTLRWGGGDGVLAWLREEGAASGVAVVLTATAGYPLGGAEVVQPPVVGFLPKPFALTALLASVRAAVAHNRSKEPYYRDHTPAGSELFIG
jgi:DNA-binding response OmpR family regulator